MHAGRRENIFFKKRVTVICIQMRRVAYGRTVPYQVTRLKWLKVEAKSRDSSSPASKGEKKNQDKESIEFFSKVVHAEWGEDLRRRKFQDESTSWGGRLVVLPCSLSLSHRNATWLWRRNCEKEKNARYQFEWRTIRVEGGRSLTAQQQQRRLYITRWRTRGCDEPDGEETTRRQQRQLEPKIRWRSGGIRFGSPKEMPSIRVT